MTLLRSLRIATAFLLPLAIFAGCKKPYDPPEIKSNVNFLVVDGIIRCGTNAVTTITLSRTANIGDSISFHPELFASVYIEQEQGSITPLTEKGNGIYQTLPVDLEPGRNYRLKIRTADNKNYLSAFSLAKVSPPIDSLDWKQDGDVTVYASTHDPANDSRYYRWEYEETWNYQSLLHAEYGVKNGMIFVVDATTQTDSCWRTDLSKTIVVANSVALTNDVINRYPIAVIQQNSEKIVKRYSLLAKQYVISEEAYTYLQLLQKNTERLGTLFDAQPSQLRGNVTAVGDESEPVLGYISASTATEKRIFIGNEDLQDWVHPLPVELCGAIQYIGQNPVDYRIWNYPDASYAPYYFVSGGGIAITKKACLDCTLQGGVNVKPSFWP